MRNMEGNPFADLEPVDKNELVRRVSKTVLHASERDRRGLFDKLTAKNAHRMAKLMAEAPVFYKNKEDAPREILLDQELAARLPDDFFDHPTRWIEKQPNITRGYDQDCVLPTGEVIEELWHMPYDVSKVKMIDLSNEEGDLRLVSKRLEPGDAREISLARRAYEAGIPTPKVMGEIMDHGNLYAWFEHVQGINYNAFLRKRIFHDLDLVRVTATSPDDFEAYFSEGSVFEDLPDSMRRELLVIYHDAEMLRLKHGFAYYIPHIEELFGGEQQSRGLTFLRYIFERMPGLAEDPAKLQLVVKYFGFKNTVDLIDRIDALAGFDQNYQLDSSSSDFFRSIKVRLSQIVREVNVINDTIRKKILTYYFGYEPWLKKQEILALCQSKGITHKDFNDRNFVIEWDMKKNIPKKNEGEQVRMFIVDWESGSNA